jgi:aryl-alcohol dehydrogenase-like predicted oxidoreductase
MQGLTIGSIGIGTYRGAATAAFDRKACAAIVSAVANGCNLIDTARSYRGGRAERVVGDAIRALSDGGMAARDELIICSKAGYLAETDARARRLAAGRVAGNVLRPDFLSSEVAGSLERIGLAAIDVYLLHNPELHLPGLGGRRFYRRLTECFEVLERFVADEKVGVYGLACWSAFDSAAPVRLDISQVLRAARRAAGTEHHHFGAIETPLNWVQRNPRAAPGQVSVVKVCRENELMLLGSSPLLGGRLARLPATLRRAIPGGHGDACSSIQFARSLPCVSATLVGMNSAVHVMENLGLRAVPPLPRSMVERLCAALDVL